MSETFTKEELVDFIDNLVKEKINNSTVPVVSFPPPPLQTDVVQIIDRLQINMRPSYVPGTYEFIIKDILTGYSKIFPIQLN